MKFKITTLVDVTESGEHRGPNELAVGQQANYNTLVQIIGLRANPSMFVPETQKKNISKMGFGNKFRGNKNIWEVEFEIEYGKITEKMLIEDFHLVPIVTGLKESVEFDINTFNTANNQEKNIIFECLRR